jgi:hypothetical protein
MCFRHKQQKIPSTTPILVEIDKNLILKMGKSMKKSPVNLLLKGIKSGSVSISEAQKINMTAIASQKSP